MYHIREVACYGDTCSYRVLQQWWTPSLRRVQIMTHPGPAGCARGIQLKPGTDIPDALQAR